MNEKLLVVMNEKLLVAMNEKSAMMGVWERFPKEMPITGKLRI